MEQTVHQTTMCKMFCQLARLGESSQTLLRRCDLFISTPFQKSRHTKSQFILRQKANHYAIDLIHCDSYIPSYEAKPIMAFYEILWFTNRLLLKLNNIKKFFF